MGIDKFCPDPIGRQGLVQQVIGTAVNGLLGNDVLARVGKGQDGIGDCCRAGSNSQASHAAFQRGHSVLQDSLGGVGQTPVDIAGVPQIKTVSRVLGAVENIGSCLVDRHRPGICRGVCLFLSYVKL